MYRCREKAVKGGKALARGCMGNQPRRQSSGTPHHSIYILEPRVEI